MCSLDSTGCGLPCKRGNEPSGFMKSGNFLDQFGRISASCKGPCSMELDKSPVYIAHLLAAVTKAVVELSHLVSVLIFACSYYVLTTLVYSTNQRFFFRLETGGQSFSHRPYLVI